MTLALLDEVAAKYLDRARSIRRASALAPLVARFASVVHLALTEQRRAIRRAIPRPGLQEDRSEPETALERLRAGERLRRGFRLSGAAAIQAGARNITFDLGVGMTFDLADPRAVAWLAAHGADLVTRIDDTTRTRMRELLRRAPIEGWDTETLAGAIATDYSFSMARSRMIARTELANAHSEGGILAARDLEDAGLVLEKQWLVNVPEDDECISNGEEGWIRLDDNFPSGHDRPPVHPNCECDVEYRVVTDPRRLTVVDLDATPVEVASVLAMRRTGSSFPKIAAAHGRTSGPWAYAIVKKHAPELLGRITPSGNVRVVRKPKAPKVAAGPAFTLPPITPTNPRPQITPAHARALAPQPYDPTFIGPVEPAGEWWKLEGDEFQRAYPEFDTYHVGAIDQAIAEHKLVADSARYPLTNWLPLEKIPPHLRDIAVARTTELPDDVVKKWVPRSGVAALVAGLTSPDGKTAIRPVPAIVVNDREKFFTIDPPYTVAHELGHQAIYRAGLLQQSADAEAAANLYANWLLGRERFNTNLRAVLGYDHPVYPLGAQPGEYTSYGGEWQRISDRARRLAARAIANTTTPQSARITMREAEARQPLVFGLWVCADGVSVAAMKMEDVP